MKQYLEKFAVTMLSFGAVGGIGILSYKLMKYLLQFDIPAWVFGFSLCVAVALMVAGIKDEE